MSISKKKQHVLYTNKLFHKNFYSKAEREKKNVFCTIYNEIYFFTNCWKFVIRHKKKWNFL